MTNYRKEGLFLAQVDDGSDSNGKWHVLDINWNMVGEFNDQESAMKEMDRLMGSTEWSTNCETIHDRTDGTALAIIQKRGKIVQ